MKPSSISLFVLLDRAFMSSLFLFFALPRFRQLKQTQTRINIRHKKPPTLAPISAQGSVLVLAAEITVGLGIVMAVGCNVAMDAGCNVGADGKSEDEEVGTTGETVLDGTTDVGTLECAKSEGEAVELLKGDMEGILEGTVVNGAALRVEGVEVGIAVG